MDLTALSSRSYTAISTSLNFYVSHGGTARFLIDGEKILYLFCRWFIAVSKV